MPKIHVVTLRFKTSDGKDLDPVSFEISDGEKGDKGDPGKDAYETWLELPGNAGKTEEQFIDHLKAEITILQVTGNSTTAVMSQKATTDAVNTRVPTNRKINNKTLNVDLTLTPSDIGSYSIQQVDDLIEDLIGRLNQNGETAAGVQADLNQFKTKVANDYVLKTRTINSKSLSSNITLTAGDIGTLTSQEITTLLAGKVGTNDPRLTDAREWSTVTMSQAEAEGGTSTARRAVTAQRLRQANAAYTLSRSEIEAITNGLVLKTTTVNGKPLSGNISIASSDVGTYNQSEINTKLNERVALTSVVQTTGTSTTNIMSQKAVTDQLNTKVPLTRTINGKALSSDINITLAELGGVATGDSRLTNSREWLADTMSQAEAEAGTATTRRAVTSQRIRQNVAAYTYSKTDIDNKDNTRVPTSRTINSKPLTADVVLTAADVGARTNTWLPTVTEIGAVSNTDSRLTDSREWMAATITQAEAEAGTATTRRAFTAQRIRQAIVAYAAAKAGSSSQVFSVATPTADAHAANKSYVDARVGASAVYAGTDNKNTNFPVGSILVAWSGSYSQTQTNQHTTLYVITDVAGYPRYGSGFYGNHNSGVSVAGTWAYRGYCGSVHNLGIFERVA